MSEQNKKMKKGILKYAKRSLSSKVFVVILVVIVFCIGIYGGKKIASTESKTTKLGFEDIGELATQIAYCTEVVVTEADRKLFGLQIPFTQSKYIYSYDMEIKAGINFTEVEWKVNNDTKEIEVSLPEVKVLSREIDQDSFRVYHEDESIFRQVSLQENNEALKEMQEKAEADAIANGLLENARSNAEIILKGFLEAEYEEYEVKFIDK